jgi:hypothetical protein
VSRLGCGRLGPTPCVACHVAGWRTPGSFDRSARLALLPTPSGENPCRSKVPRGCPGEGSGWWWQPLGPVQSSALRFLSLRADSCDHRGRSVRLHRFTWGIRRFQTRLRTPETCGAWGEMRVRGRMLVPPIAEILCQRCGAQTEAVIAKGRASVRPCPCGGARQVVRVVHHRGGEASASPVQVERNVRHRSDEEAPPHGRRNRP